MKTHNATDAPAGRLLGLIFLLLAAGIGAAGLFYYRGYERQFRAEVERQLSTIANLKVEQLANWRRERLGDASVFHQNPAFATLVRRALDNPQDREAQAPLVVWLGRVHEFYQYDRVFLLDPRGIERLAVPAAPERAPSVLARRVREVLRSGQVAWVDFYREESDQRVRLALLVPVRDGPPNDRALGVLVLRLDPDKYLYPFLKRWPTPSRTAETLLVRRDGNDALFLNELKFATNTALRQRIPLADTNIAAVKAALGQEGIVDGIDYRGEVVVAALRAIPASPWFMVARMDAAEVYAPLRERLGMLTTFVGVLLLGSGAAVGMVWRWQRERWMIRGLIERRRTEEELRQSEARLRAVLDATPFPVALVDLEDNHIDFWSRGALRLFGHTAPTAAEWYQLAYPDPDYRREVIERWKPHLEMARRSSQAVNTGEYRVACHDGSARTCELHAAFLADRLMVTFHDVTERRRAEAEIRRLNAGLEQRVLERTAQLEAANKELEAFSYSVSHDLRAPLRHINGYADLLVERCRDALGDQGRHYLDTIADAARQMGRLIDDLLRFSRTGRAELRQAGLDMNQALRDALVPLRTESAARAIEWVIGELPRVCGDYAMLRQVWANLLGNAIKYTGTRERARIEVGAREEAAETVFFVRDNGVGFDMQYAGKLFGVFQRLHRVEAFEGTGIGLATVRRILTRHGGRVWAEAELDQGAIFYFTLPKTPISGLLDAQGVQVSTVL